MQSRDIWINIEAYSFLKGKRSKEERHNIDNPKLHPRSETVKSIRLTRFAAVGPRGVYSSWQRDTFPPGLLRITPGSHKLWIRQRPNTGEHKSFTAYHGLGAQIAR